MTSREHEVAQADDHRQATQAMEHLQERTTQAQAMGYAAAVFCGAFLQGVAELPEKLTREEQLHLLDVALGQL